MVAQAERKDLDVEKTVQSYFFHKILLIESKIVLIIWTMSGKYYMQQEEKQKSKPR